ncbi:MAG TPA: PIG-L deacetylase family protein [Acidimicrobiales bacterium]|jgi:LmbE family N-acetylglucosaminyl deacetylase|nr:PIG-L deacetylase family protein [Acidimicrobiales bacterium]
MLDIGAGSKVLVVAPHADDETIGLGGTIAKLAMKGAVVVVAVFTGPGPNGHRTIPADVFSTAREEALRAHRRLGVAETIFDNLPAVGVAELPLSERNASVHDVLAQVRPDVVFCPFPYDLHADHRAIFHALTVAWRPTTDVGRQIRGILCYETMSETHWNVPYLEAGFLPTVACDVTDTLATKIEALLEFESQMKQPPHARSIQAIEGLARFRGGQFGFDAAEAFVLVRSTF